MGFFDSLRHELIDIVEWTDPSRDTMVYRFERHDNEIKNGAQLIVREGQVAVFVNEGKLADIFAPGRYELETKNLPILATLQGWKYGFDSPFKCEVYFVATRRFSELKWGTKNPITLRDADFGMVRLRAFGAYEIRVSDPAAFVRQVVGTDGVLTSGDITGQLRDMIVARFADILGESKIPVLDLAANYDEFGKFLTQRMAGEFNEYGVEITRMLVENISLPAEVEAALDKRSSMGAVGDLNRFTQYQSAIAIEKAAENPGGTAAGGMGLGMGFAMANQMAQTMGAGHAGTGATPPPLVGGWFLVQGGQQTGPFDMAALAAQARAGQLTPQTLVWCQGMANWLSADQVEALRPLLASTPPPLPPQ